MRWQLDLSSAAPQARPDLDPQQQRVVDHRTGPLLVLAGPGTGKTTTIVEAICARLTDAADPVAPEQVLGLTFGRRAATELRDRVSARIGGGLLPTIATFHAFAYGLVRSLATVEAYMEPPRLMSGAEEDVRIRELLLGAVEDGSVTWPDDLTGALPTLGLANEVRGVLARARDLGISGAQLARLGERSGRPAWTAIGQFARQEQDVMVMENVMDYGELMRLAVNRAGDPDVAPALLGRYRAIFVDEYQDTDRQQVDLLRRLVGAQTALVAVGDPDQAIYGFRGADVTGLLRFRSDFPTAGGAPAPVVVLDQTRRFGPRIRSVATQVIGTRTPPGLTVADVHRHRHPSCAPAGGPDDDVVTVRSYDSRGAQAAHIAREIRMAHVEREVPWRRLAVLVRTGHQIPLVQRALQVAGVPVVVAADEVPLRAEPAVAAVLAPMTMAAHPQAATPAQVLDVLTGPIIGLTATDVRRLGRDLRAQQHRAGYATPPSESLTRALVLASLLAQEPPPCGLAVDDPARLAVERLTQLLQALRAQIEGGAEPQEVLWTAWTGGARPHGWPQRLRAAALQGSRSADHDLDAILALFDAAERLAGRYPGFLGVRMFVDSLADQQIPAEAVADRGTRADAVRVLTAHRAKGLEWDEVWIVGAEEGVWPDLRPRGSTLRAEELAADGVGEGPRPGDLLEEERRLFYVACTRARRQLHITAIDEQDDGGDQPSRFLDDVHAALDTAPGAPVAGRPRDAVTLDGLVARLRRTAVDPSASGPLREAAVERLAVLAAQRDDDGRPLVPSADPDAWWGIAEPTASDHAVRDPERPVSMSGSSLDSVLECPLRFFLEHEAHAETTRGTATAFGSVVHAVADFVAKGEIPAVLDDMDAEVDRVWSALRFEAAWQSAAERREVRDALARFLGYHVRADRELVDTETYASAELPVPTPEGEALVRLSGYIDRVERDADGRLVAIDLKNMKRPVPNAKVPEHGQLGVYQLLLREDGPVGGAALVQLRVNEGSAPSDPKVQMQDALPDERPTWVEERLGEAVRILRTEEFTARPSKACTYCAYRSACPATSAAVTP